MIDTYVCMFSAFFFQKEKNNDNMNAFQKHSKIAKIHSHLLIYIDKGN